MKKIITLVAALAGFSLAILIPVVASSAETVTTCPTGASLEYCSVSVFPRWTVVQKGSTVTVRVRFNSGSFKVVDLGLPGGVRFSATSAKTIQKRLSFTPLTSSGRPEKTKVEYAVETAPGNHLAVTLNSTPRSAEMVFTESLFTTKDKKFRASLVIRTRGGDTYLEQVPVRL